MREREREIPQTFNSLENLADFCI